MALSRFHGRGEGGRVKALEGSSYPLVHPSNSFVLEVYMSTLIP